MHTSASSLQVQIDNTSPQFFSQANITRKCGHRDKPTWHLHLGNLEVRATSCAMCCPSWGKDGSEEKSWWKNASLFPSPGKQYPGTFLKASQRFCVIELQAPEAVASWTERPCMLYPLTLCPQEPLSACFLGSHFQVSHLYTRLFLRFWFKVS